jgi:soluble lytic murein transglycosylase-like protein
MSAEQRQETMEFERLEASQGARPRRRAASALAALLCGAAVFGLVSEAGSASAPGIERRVGVDGVIEFSSRAKPARGKAAARAATGVSRPKVVMPAAGSGALASQYDAYIAEAARLYHIPQALVRAVIQVESNFDPRAVSPANAQGLMQMIPDTAERMMVTDIFDPRQNILGGTRYLRILANTFNGDLQLTIAGYNAGEGAVAKYQGIPPYRETREYVARVLEAYRRFQER